MTDLQARNAELDTIRAQEPVAYQFKCLTGKWHNFINEEHYENTKRAGDWPIRELFTHAPDSAARIAELERANQDLRNELYVHQKNPLCARVAKDAIRISKLDEYADEDRRQMRHADTGLQKIENLKSALREAKEALQTYVDEHEECTDADDWMAMVCSMEAHHVAEKAIATIKTALGEE